MWPGLAKVVGVEGRINAEIVLGVKRFQHGLGVAFGDAEEGAGGAFGAAVALFPVLEGPRADADQDGKLALRQAELFAHNTGIWPMDFGGAGGFGFPAQDGTTFFEAGDELLE